MVVAGLAAAVVIFFTPALATRDVTIEGTSLLSEQQVAEAAQIPVGLPLARQDIAAIEERTRTLPPVKDVVARRDWPHSVHLQVTERTPVLALQDGDGVQLVDGDGVRYAHVDWAPEGLLVASDGVHHSGAATSMASAVGALPPALREQVVAIEAGSAEDVRLRLQDDTQVVWGGADDAQLKSQVLEELLREAPGASVYNVSAPSFPVTE